MILKGVPISFTPLHKVSVLVELVIAQENKKSV
jgi:hypothetical protein